MKKRWAHLLVGAEEAVKTVVFSGGACNLTDAEGRSQRNPRRDPVNEVLNALCLPFFDPQIHPDTHGRGYDYSLDAPAEKAARNAAHVTFYEIGDDTLASVTNDEVRADVSAGKPVIVWFSGAKDGKGRPIFVPQGIDDLDLPAVVQAHLREYTKAGNRVRAELRDFLDLKPNVYFARSAEDARTIFREIFIRS